MGEIDPIPDKSAWSKTLLLIAIAFPVTYLVEHYTGSKLWGFIACSFIAISFLIILVIRNHVRSPSRKMALLIQSKQYDEAIKFGESLPVPSRDLFVLINLVAAYYFSGQIEKARKTVDSIVDPGDSPVLTEVIDDWRAKLRASSLEGLKP